MRIFIVVCSDFCGRDYTTVDIIFIFLTAIFPIIEALPINICIVKDGGCIFFTIRIVSSFAAVDLMTLGATLLGYRAILM